MAGSDAGKGTRGTAKRSRARKQVEYSTLLLRCPLCSTEFSSEVPRVQDPVGRDTDLRPVYQFVDPLATLIHSCPSCHYTAFKEGYGVRRGEDEDEEAQLRPGDREPARFPVPDDHELEDLRRFVRRGDLVRGVAEGREPYGGERYLLGGRVYEFLREDDVYGAADYFLRGAWCARALGDRQLELACQRETLQRLQHALDQSQVPEGDKARTTYLVGELSRRSGDFPKAVDLFSQLESLVDPEEPEGSLFGYLARRQLSLAMVKSDINAQIDEADLELELVDDDEDDGPRGGYDEE